MSINLTGPLAFTKVGAAVAAVVISAFAALAMLFDVAGSSDTALKTLATIWTVSNTWIGFAVVHIAAWGFILH